MTPSRKQSMGPYELLAPLGAGGMGEVFRARDTRLNREVAIKVLPKEFASDRERLRRFELESETLASLNHPNILTLHDAGVQDESPYLVSELLTHSRQDQEWAFFRFHPGTSVPDGNLFL